MSDERRTGDVRPENRPEGVGLTMFPHDGLSQVRWLPRHGEPLCILDWVSQSTVRLLAWLPFYTALIVTLMLAIELFHPWGLGK